MNAPIRTHIPHIDSFRKISVHSLSSNLHFICHEESSYLGECQTLSAQEENEYIDTILTLFNASIDGIATRAIITYRLKQIGFWAEHPTTIEPQRSIDTGVECRLKNTVAKS